MSIREQRTYSVSAMSAALAELIPAVNAGALSLNPDVDATGAEINVLHGVTPGTVIASHAVVTGAGNSVDTFDTAELKIGGAAITATAAEVNTLDGITSSVAELNILTGVTATAADLNQVAGLTAGTVAASKALVVDSNKRLDTLVIADGGLKLGTAGGTAIGATAAEINQACDVSARTQELTVSGAVGVGAQFVELNHATVVVAATIANSNAHQGLFCVKDTSATGTVNHTLTLTSGTFDGTHNIATFNARDDALVVWFDSAGRGTIVQNVGSVALS